MTSSSIVKYWGRINEFKPDLFDWYNNIRIPAFAHELFDSTKYESFFLNIGTNKIIYRINSNSSCKAISIISTDSSKKWAGGRPGAHLGCTIFFPVQTIVNEKSVFEVLSKLLSEASNKIEENGNILLNEEEKDGLYDFAHKNSTSCIIDTNYKKKKLDLSYRDTIFAVTSSQFTDVFSKVFKYDFISSFYLIDFSGDLENRYYKRSENINDLLTNLVDPIEIWGCTDPSALNYNQSATKDDGSCEFKTKPPFPWSLIIYSMLLITPVVIIYLNRDSIMNMFKSIGYQDIADTTQIIDSKETTFEDSKETEGGIYSDEVVDTLEINNEVVDTVENNINETIDDLTEVTDTSNDVSSESNPNANATPATTTQIPTTLESLVKVYKSIIEEVECYDLQEFPEILLDSVHIRIIGEQHDTSKYEFEELKNRVENIIDCDEIPENQLRVWIRKINNQLPPEYKYNYE